MFLANILERTCKSSVCRGYGVNNSGVLCLLQGDCALLNFRLDLLLQKLNLEKLINLTETQE